MTSSMEFRAKTVGKAIENACRELNISSENLVHDVISPGSKGLFGLIGSKPAKIRVRINDQAQRIHTEADQAAKPCTTRVDPEPSRENKGAKPGPATPRGENEPAAQLCQEAVKRLIAPMDPEATIESSARGGRIDINISGGDPALIIGKHGQTIDAVQYLVEKIVNRATKRRVRIQVDVAGYQAARQKKPSPPCRQAGGKGAAHRPALQPRADERQRPTDRSSGSQRRPQHPDPERW